MADRSNPAAPRGVDAMYAALRGSAPRHKSTPKSTSATSVLKQPTSKGIEAFFIRVHNAELGDHDPFWQIAQGILVAPLRSKTLPPATHTNAYVLGEGDVVVVDPGSPDRSEVQRLIDGLKRRSLRLRAIVLTHHHADHVSGCSILQNESKAPIWAHRETARLIGRKLKTERQLRGGENLQWGGERFKVIETPGHAPGHLCFLHQSSGALIAGDMVAGEGFIYIDPDEGDMGKYIESLKLLRALKPSALLPAHGAPISNPVIYLDEYIAHRLKREAAILAALTRYPASEQSLVESVYASTPKHLWPIAKKQARSHLLKLQSEGRAQCLLKGWVLT